MSAELAQLVALIAVDGLQVNLWPTETGYQANVKERGAPGWTIASDPEAVQALLKALRMRNARLPCRKVVADVDAQQVDIEEAIAAADAVDLTEFGL